MFTAMQPYGPLFREGCTDGGGAHGTFRQIHAQAGDVVHSFVMPVDGATQVEQDTLRICNECKKLRTSNGTA